MITRINAQLCPPRNIIGQQLRQGCPSRNSLSCHVFVGGITWRYKSLSALWVLQIFDCTLRCSEFIKDRTYGQYRLTRRLRAIEYFKQSNESILSPHWSTTPNDSVLFIRRTHSCCKSGSFGSLPTNGGESEQEDTEMTETVSILNNPTDSSVTTHCSTVGKCKHCKKKRKC
jgi:hypothetical protein